MSSAESGGSAPADGLDQPGVAVGASAAVLLGGAAAPIRRPLPKYVCTVLFLQVRTLLCGSIIFDTVKAGWNMASPDLTNQRLRCLIQEG